MSAFIVTALIIVAVLIGMGLYRVWAGPTLFDRLVAVALVSVNGVVVIVLLGIVLDRPNLFFDIALGFASLAFLLPITLGRYFEGRDDGTSSDGAPSLRTRPTPHGIVPHGWVAERGRQESLRRARQRGITLPLSTDTDDAGRPVPPAEGPGPSVPIERPDEPAEDQSNEPDTTDPADGTDDGEDRT